MENSGFTSPPKVSQDHFFYPRPILAFEYCHCLRPCVCVSVRVYVNYLFVCMITRHLFKGGSPNLVQMCKRPWLRSQLFFGVNDRDLQGQIYLESPNLPHFELVCTITHHSFKLEPSNFGPGVQNTLVKIPIVWGGNWPWPSRSNLTWNQNFQLRHFRKHITII